MTELPIQFIVWCISTSNDVYRQLWVANDWHGNGGDGGKYHSVGRYNILKNLQMKIYIPIPILNCKLKVCNSFETSWESANLTDRSVVLGNNKLEDLYITPLGSITNGYIALIYC